MSEITFKGEKIQTVGTLPSVGSKAPPFILTNSSLEDVGLDSFAGKRKLLNIVPSLDTGICAMSAERFNLDFNKNANAVLLNISADLPFASARFCASKGLGNVVTLSSFRSPAFGIDYGVTITSGALAGLLSRAVLVLDENDTIVYAEQVQEIAQEPDYSAALQSLQ